MSMWLLLLILASITAVERIAPARRDASQLWFNIFASAANRFVQIGASPTIALTISHAVAHVGVPSLYLARWSLPCGAIVYIAVMDLGEYGFHRAQHTFPFLWRMHALHHSDPCMSALTAERHFWGETLIKGFTIWPAVAMLTSPSSADIAIYSLVGLYHIFVHANLGVNYGPFSWILNSPAYHRIHHSREPGDHGANFSALFPIFDVLLGSYRRPRHSPATGLSAQPRNALEILTWPLHASDL